MRQLRWIGIMLSVLLVSVFLGDVTSFAESRYRTIYADFDHTSFNNGAYRFEYKPGATWDSASLKIWKKGGKKPIKTLKNVGYYIVLNDEKIYFVRKNSIMEFKLETLKLKQVINEANEPHICDVKGSSVFYTMMPTNSTSDFVRYLYSYDMKNKKVLLLSENAGNCYLGKDKLAYTLPTSDVSPTALFSVDYDGKNVKKLAEYAMGVKVMNNKIYYCGFKSYYPMIGDVYCSNLDGSAKKKLSKKKLKAQGIHDITQKYVIYYNDNFEKMKMDFQSGKIVKVK